ncbi:MAG TPA: hypothetical protein VN026_03250, partial [Bacteroidia bacterium]|nr:hypothetical protein [Bacteroidia bacterium]
EKRSKDLEEENKLTKDLSETTIHDYKIFKCLNYARTNLDKVKSNKAFRYAEYIMKDLGESKNKEAEDFIKQSFESKSIGTGLEKKLITYPLIIVADSNSKKIKIANIIDSTIKEYDYVLRSPIIFTEDSKEMLFYKTSKLLILYNLTRREILQTIPVDSIMPLFLTPDMNYIFFGTNNDIKGYDINLKQFNSLGLKNISYRLDLFYFNNHLFTDDILKDKFKNYNLKKYEGNLKTYFSNDIKYDDLLNVKYNDSIFGFTFIKYSIEKVELRRNYLSFNKFDYKAPTDQFDIENILYWINERKIFGAIPELTKKEIKEIKSTGEFVRPKRDI